MQITISVGDDVLRRFSNQIGALGQGEAHKALARAVNRVTNTVHGRVIRAVAKQSSIPVAVVRRTIKKRLVSPNSSHPGASDLEGVVWATGRELPLSAFNPRQFSWGVRAKVWGSVQRYPGAFIYAGSFRSGKPIAGNNAFTNTRGYSESSGRNNAIERMFGPSIPEEMVRGESERIFRETADTMLPQRVAHELNRLLP